MASALIVRRAKGGTFADSALDCVPALVAELGASASERFIEFFTANISNANTRAAYARAVAAFLNWCEGNRLRTLQGVRPVHVAAYIKELQETHAKASVKQSLAALRMLFDWLVVGQVLPTNPAHSVRGPKHIIEKGKTPILSPEEARQLIASVDTSHLVGLRDRALIATMLYSFARVEATVGMDITDYYLQGSRAWLRLHEKGGKFHEMPAHHKLEDYLNAYIAAAGGADEFPPERSLHGRLTKRRALFRTANGKTKRLTTNRMTRKDDWSMIRRRVADAGIETLIGRHSFRATGITNYLENGGTLEKAQKMAGHSSARTTKLYDRRDDQVTLDEIERIAI